MARTLNTGYTYYGNLLHCLVVDEGQLKDLAGGVTFSNTGSPTFGSTSWAGDSSTVEYAETNGSNYMEVATGALNLRFGGNSTVFLAAADFISSENISSGSNFLAGVVASTLGIVTSATNFTTYLGVRTSASNYKYTSSNFLTDQGNYASRAGQTTAAFTCAGTDSAARKAYVDGSHDTGAPTGATQASEINFALTKIGISADDSNRWIGSKFMCLLVFDATLDDTAVADLHANWPTLLFSGAASTPTISDAGDEVYTDGEAGIVITGSNFGATQGTVKISPTDDVNDVNAVAQAVTAWGDTSITITANRGSLAFNTNMYLFVIDEASASNASGWVVQFEPVVTVTETLVDLNGDPVASETGLTVFVWTEDPANAANPTSPHTTFYAESTDVHGDMTFGLVAGGLSPGDPVWIAVMKDGSPYRATLRKITPTYS